MIRIEIQNGNICQLDGDRKALIKLYDLFRVKHPGSWHIMMYQKGKTRWDGFIKYISDAGRFKIGLLPKVVEEAKRLGQKVKVVDKRAPIPQPKVPKTLGDRTLYPRQVKALEKILFNKVEGVPFNICAGDLAVGFGKSTLFAAIHKAFSNKLKTVLLLNDADLFNQFKREIPPMLPGIDIQFIQGSKVTHWGDFNVAMVQSLARNIKKYQWDLSRVDICLIDEADVIDNRTYKVVIEHLYNARIRVGLSGTLYMSKFKKDLMHNMNVMSFIGEKVDTVKLIDQMKAGKATPVIVKMVSTHIGEKWDDYKDEYDHVITYNKEAYKASFQRAMFNAQYHRYPMLIVTKYIDHCEKLYQYYQEKNKALNLKLKIAYAHHETKNRTQILEDFRLGKIDILISTTIISRGKNFPTLRYLQNTASMDSNEKSIQILGRLVRQCEGKDKAYLDDLAFEGHYLSRHAKHRKVYYQREKLKVIIVNRVRK